MSKFEERSPEELRAWLEESDIAREFVAFLAEARANNVHMIIGSHRTLNPLVHPARYTGVIDFIDGIVSIIDRKPEKK